jgi:hypothetical protein
MPLLIKLLTNKYNDYRIDRAVMDKLDMKSLPQPLLIELVKRYPLEGIGRIAIEYITDKNTRQVLEDYISDCRSEINVEEENRQLDEMDEYGSTERRPRGWWVRDLES